VILHLLLPELFAIWDNRARQSILGDENRNDGKSYAEFLAYAQKEIRELIGYGSPLYESNIERITKEAGEYSPARLISEYLYTLYREKQ
jgi:hypothetical protein